MTDRGAISKFDISTVITAHHEGVKAGISLHSLLDAKDHFEKSGRTVECLVILDRPDERTRDVFRDCAEMGYRVVETDVGDQGLARNEGVALSAGKFIAFLDADDLWSYNWLDEAWRVCQTDPKRTIAHPEYNWFFQGSNNLLVKMDQMSPYFRAEFLRFSNYWDALCLAPHRAYLDHPFAKRDITGGFAYEDWQWNCETLEDGYIHRIVDGTVHFKRRRANSQTMEASKRGALTRLTRLTDYAWSPGGLVDE